MTRRKFRPLRRRTGEGLHPPATAQEPLPVTGIPDEVQHPVTEERAPKKPKTPPSLTRYFPIAGLHEATILRLGGVEVSVMEVRGLEVEQPIMGAFAAVLNALDFPVQLLVRQHPPRLGALRDALEERRPSKRPGRGRCPGVGLFRGVPGRA